jgi:hypothetical protein
MVQQYFKQNTTKSFKLFFILLHTIVPLFKYTQSGILEKHLMKIIVSGELYKDAAEKQGNMV